MELLRPCSEGNSPSVTREIPCLLWNTRVNYYIDSAPLVWIEKRVCPLSHVLVGCTEDIYTPTCALYIPNASYLQFIYLHCVLI